MYYKIKVAGLYYLVKMLHDEGCHIVTYVKSATQKVKGKSQISEAQKHYSCNDYVIIQFVDV